MENKKLETILTNLGLNDKEANIYLSCLSLGPTTILKIARSSGLKRTSIYSIIESLKSKGLVNIQIKGWKKLFIAESPEKLENIIENSRLEFKNHLPDFLSLYNLKESESFIRYYEGKEAVRSVYGNLLKGLRPHDDYMVIADQEKWFESDEKYFSKFIEKRAKLNIHIRLLLQDSKSAREFKKIEKNFNEKIKILPRGKTFNTNLMITPEKSVIHQLTTPISAMVIENKNIARMHKEIFEMLWKTIGNS